MATENIKIEKLFPHPDNPRRDLGDLTELAESIKARGVMQNLTVVKDHDKEGYTVVIGHRRLAAAKLAGLTELPCVVASMDAKEQVATMLLENMQRNDLTVIEQAQGFQMMLDLGETAQTIAEKTGFSETTVRKRLFIATLDKKKAQKAYENGATLDDYLKLQQINSKGKRNKVLAEIGTNNFNRALQAAISEELRDKIAPEMIKLIEVFAKPSDKEYWQLPGYGYHEMHRYSDFEKTGKLSKAAPKKFAPDEYLYYVDLQGIEIYKKHSNTASSSGEKKMSELPPEEQEKRREARRKYKALKELGETTYQLRLNFVKSFSQSLKAAMGNDQLKALSEFAFAAVCLGDKLDFSHYAGLLDIEYKYGLKLHQKMELAVNAGSSGSNMLLMSLYSMFRDSEMNTYYSGPETTPEKRGQHKTNEKLSAIYDCLCALGYQMSDDEQALRDGTHEMFLKKTGGK